MMRVDYRGTFIEEDSKTRIISSVHSWKKDKFKKRMIEPNAPLIIKSLCRHLEIAY
jgi:hypothetical protein